MKTWFAKLAAGLTLLAATSGLALAQAGDPAAAKPAAASTAAPAVQSMSNIESDDILYMKQNQAERTQVQPGNLAPVYRQVKEGGEHYSCLLYTSPSPRDQRGSRMPSSA